MKRGILGLCVISMLLSCHQGQTQLSQNSKETITKILYSEMDSIDAYYGEAIVMAVKSGEELTKVQLSRKDHFGNGNINTDSCAEHIGYFVQPAILKLALDKGVSLGKEYDTDIGIKVFGSDTIKDNVWREGGYGELTVERGIELGSNVLFASLATDLYGNDKANLSKDLQQFKLGDTDTTKSVAVISSGYANKLKPLEILSFYNNIAKNGSKEVKAALQAVVEKGLGKHAQTKVVSTAGKSSRTGISSKGDVSKYQIGFCGYFPADKPKYSVIVIMKKQGLPASGSMSASVFRDIAEYLSR